MAETQTNENKYCPPHRSLPLIGKIRTDKLCCLDRSGIRMLPRAIYCAVRRCPHYEEALDKLEEAENKGQCQF